MPLTKRLGMRTSAGLSTLLTVVALAGLALLVGVTSQALGDDKPQSELLKPFQGTWATDGEGIDAKWTFDGEKVKATVNGTDYTCKVKVDTEAKPNPTIDLDDRRWPRGSQGQDLEGHLQARRRKAHSLRLRPRQRSAQGIRPGRRRSLPLHLEEAEVKIRLDQATRIVAGPGSNTGTMLPGSARACRWS